MKDIKLEKEVVEKNYEEFVALLQQNISRDERGVDRLIEWLGNKDTKVAPASTKYHLACDGGLIQHSLNVYNRLRKLIIAEYGEDVEQWKYTEETIAIVALLHDVSKVGFYEETVKNVKEYCDGGSKWDAKGTYEWKTEKSFIVKSAEERLFYGSHSLNSVYIIKKFLNLTYDEEIAILYHMGGFDVDEGVSNSTNVSLAYVKCPLALLLHTADMLATYIDDEVV